MTTVKTIRALSRGLDVLRHLETGGATLHALAARTKLPKATLLRILATLEREGYVRRGIADQLYHHNFRPTRPPETGWKAVLAEVAGPVLDGLCHKVLWPSDVGVYEDGAIRVQETSRRISPFLLNRDVLDHEIHVLQSAMGRAFLAWSDEERREKVLARLSRSRDLHNRLARDREKVAALVSNVRDRGYAVREPGYFITQPREARVSAIAVPVFLDARSVGAINLAWVSSAMSEQAFVAQHLPSLKSAAREISAGVDVRFKHARTVR
ncbi:helix-turn-helix domain-containing protein [Chelativorans xinjiangense]|uniref:helix-turn-helix domain-containing protein n=1 Tax=Chelativorans xinjiangense TaxID=2681485 RepID=UPI00135AAA3E|nr:helix-turn-helix domain-containing protein [Chelativorans xinjiangense]